MQTPLPKLETPRTFMRLAYLSDIPAIIHYYASNQAHLKPFEPTKNDEFYTEGYWRLEVQKRLDDFHADKSFKLLLFAKEIPTEVIGIINFANFVRGAFQACTLGYSVAASKQGKGYMSEALEVAIRYVFNQLNMHRIIAAYIPTNQRSGLLLKRLGFLVEGYARDYIQIDGMWQDHILTSLINRTENNP